MGPLEFYIHINDSIENFINWSAKETRGLDCTLVQTAGRLNGSHNASCIWIGRTLHSHKVVLLSSPSVCSLSLFSLVLVLWYLSLEQQSSGVRRGVQTRRSSCCYQSEPTSAGFTSPQDPLRHARQTQTWPPVRPYIKSTEAMSAQPYRGHHAKPRWKKCHWECQGCLVSHFGSLSISSVSTYARCLMWIT